MENIIYRQEGRDHGGVKKKKKRANIGCTYIRAGKQPQSQKGNADMIGTADWGRKKGDRLFELFGQFISI